MILLYVLFPSILTRMLMAQLWWVQAYVTMKRWRDINDSLLSKTGRIKSHIKRLAYLWEGMFTALLQVSPEQRNITLTELITSAMLYALLYWCWMFLWCWRVEAPCYRCQLTGHHKIFPSDRISKNERDREISTYYTIMSFHFEAMCWRFSLSACKGNSKAIHLSLLSLRKGESP